MAFSGVKQKQRWRMDRQHADIKQQPGNGGVRIKKRLPKRFA